MVGNERERKGVLLFIAVGKGGREERDAVNVVEGKENEKEIGNGKDGGERKEDQP